MATKIKPIPTFSQASIETLSKCLLEANAKYGQGNRFNKNESFSRNLPKMKILVILGNDLQESTKVKIKHQLQKMIGESPVKIIEMGESITSMYSFTYKGNYDFYRSPQGESSIDENGEMIYIAKDSKIDVENLSNIITQTRPDFTMIFSTKHSYNSSNFTNFIVKKDEITLNNVKKNIQQEV